MSGERVLLVDDEEDFLEALSGRLKVRGLKVDVALNGLKALEKVKEKTYDAVILDLAMPEMDGFETLNRLLENNPDMQIILLTGQATVSKAVEAMQTGALDFLEKPADIQRLMEKIRQAGQNRVVLVEKRTEKIIKEILKTKGW